MTTLVEVVYPQNPSWASASQLNIGPYFVPAVNWLLRAEFRGRLNFQGALIGNSGVSTNSQLWAVQWVPHGSPPADCVTTADGVNWLMRQQAGDSDDRTFWSNATADAYELASVGMKADWAGQLAIGAGIDLYWSTKPPTGLVPDNFNVFGSLRFWWA